MPQYEKNREPGRRVRVVPLGGLGEIGMNCLVVELLKSSGDDQGAPGPSRLLIDCGTSFPQGDYGIDVVHPDFSWLESDPKSVAGVFLTHGHEDHIGGLPYLLKRMNVPVWGPAHALRLAQRRLLRHDLKLSDFTFREVTADCRVAAGPFVVEPIRMSHSIVDATGLVIRTPAGTLVHTGDFKLDPAPADGELTNVKRLEEVGADGVELLLSDSTNIDRTAHSGSEVEVAEVLDQLIAGSKHRVVVALFASNVQRLISLGKIAQRRGRRICLLGRSLMTHVEIAQELGHLRWPPDLILPPERARTYPRGELLVLATGTQAETGSAMQRIAERSNRYIELSPGDQVMFSSRIIPGNERPVVELFGDLLRQGAKLHSPFTDPIHTSGHASRPELKEMLELVRPRGFVPVHGTRHHLERHAELARDVGVQQVEVIENGETVIFGDGRLCRGEPVSTARVHVEWGGQRVSPHTLRERRELGRSGLISVGVCCDRGWKLLGRPSLDSYGLPGLARSDEHLGRLSEQLTEHWRSISRGHGKASEESTIEQVEKFVRSWADELWGLRPVVRVNISRIKERGL